jgi:hypothetical protein
MFALLVNPNPANTERDVTEAQEAARAKGVQLQILKAGTEGEIGDAFTSLVKLHARALIVRPTPSSQSAAGAHDRRHERARPQGGPSIRAFIGRSPDTVTAEELRVLQLHQTQSGVQPPTINGAVSALRFFFMVTLDRPDLARRLTRRAVPAADTDCSQHRGGEAAAASGIGAEVQGGVRHRLRRGVGAGACISTARVGVAFSARHPLGCRRIPPFDRPSL